MGSVGHSSAKLAELAPQSIRRKALEEQAGARKEISPAESERRELESRLLILLAHLLKWQYQHPLLSERWGEFDGRSWRGTIVEQGGLPADYPTVAAQPRDRYLQVLLMRL